MGSSVTWLHSLLLKYGSQQNLFYFFRDVVRNWDSSTTQIHRESLPAEAFSIRVEFCVSFSLRTTDTQLILRSRGLASANVTKRMTWFWDQSVWLSHHVGNWAAERRLQIGENKSDGKQHRPAMSWYCQLSHFTLLNNAKQFIYCTYNV